MQLINNGLKVTFGKHIYNDVYSKVEKYMSQDLFFLHLNQI